MHLITQKNWQKQKNRPFTLMIWDQWVETSFPYLLFKTSRTSSAPLPLKAQASLVQPRPTSPRSPFPLHHCVWRQEVGRAARLMTVLTTYLSSNWRVMRHLSNLNIFHWVVMAPSPGPRVRVFLSDWTWIWMLIVSSWTCAYEKVRSCK